MVGGLQGRAVIEHARVGDLPLRREIDPVQAELGPADRVGRYAHTGRETPGEDGRGAGPAPQHVEVSQQHRRWRSIVLVLPRQGLHQARSEEHTSELQSLMRISYAVFCLKKKKEKS